MGVMMLMARQPRVMGGLTIPRPLAAVGWLTTAVMAVAVAAMFATW